MLQAIFFETDMTQGVKMQRLGRLFASGDKAAHTFKVRVKGADLSGYSADGYMIRATNDTVLVSATVDGDTVIATLPEACYTVPGGFSLIIRVSKSDEQTAVFWGVGTITRSRTDVVVDTEKKIPSLEELLAQIDALNTATSEAKKATTAANDAYQRADAAAKQAATSATSADAAAQRAETAAKGWENDKASDSAKLGGKEPRYYIQPRNLLDNSDFTNLVAQAGIGGMHGTERYAADRWWNQYRYGNISQNSSGLTIEYTENQCWITQKLELDAYVGKELTLAVQTTDGLAIGHCNEFSTTGIMISIVSVPDLLVRLQDNTVSIISMMQNIPKTIVWAALYEGGYNAETLPPYVPKGYAAELAECMRYYRVLHIGGVGKGAYIGGVWPITPLLRIDSPTATLIGAIQTTNGETTISRGGFEPGMGSIRMDCIVTSSDFNWWQATYEVSADL